MREGDRALKQLSKKCNFADVIVVGGKGLFLADRSRKLLSMHFLSWRPTKEVSRD